MKSLLDAVAEFLVQQSWQISIVFGLVLFVCLLLRSASAHWRYLVWIVLIAKCLAPPIVSIQLPLLPVDSLKNSLASATHVIQSSNIGTFAAPITENVQGSKSNSVETECAATQPLATSTAARDLIPSSPETLSLRHWLVTGWLLIAGILIVHIAGRMWLTSRRLRNTTQLANDETQAEVAALAKALGMKKPPVVFMADSIARPFVLGWLRGDIYLPLSFSSMATIDQRRAILTHELAHVLRWDAAVNHLQNLIQALFFFHPLILWANRKIRMEREKCCDEVVLSTSDLKPCVYCEAIVDMMGRGCSSPRFAPALAVTGAIQNVKERITTMLSPNRKFNRQPSRVAVLTVLLFAACVLPLTIVVTAQDGNVAQDGSPDAAAKKAASEPKLADEKKVPQPDFIVSAAEFENAANTLRNKGGRVRTFHERGNPEHWVQIILESRSLALGERPSFQPVDETRSPAFNDDDLTLVRTLTLDAPSHVHLRGGTFSAKGISHLSGTKVQRLEVSGCPFADAEAAELSKLKLLEDISIESWDLTSLGIEALSKCTELKSIGFSDELAGFADALEVLPRLPKLEAVSLGGQFDAETASVLSACKALKSLSIRIVDREESQAFLQITSLQSLTKAELSGGGITEELIVALTQKAKNLEQLYLRRHNGATLPAMKAIAELPNLEVLSLDGSNVTDAGVEALEMTPNLRWLDLSQTKVTDRSLIAIGNMPKMGMLGLMHTKVSSAGLDHLSRLTKLWHLNVQGTGVQAIPDWMRDRPRLQVSYDKNSR